MQFCISGSAGKNKKRFKIVKHLHYVCSKQKLNDEIRKEKHETAHILMSKFTSQCVGSNKLLQFKQQQRPQNPHPHHKNRKRKKKEERRICGGFFDWPNRSSNFQIRISMEVLHFFYQKEVQMSCIPSRYCMPSNQVHQTLTS